MDRRFRILLAASPALVLAMACGGPAVGGGGSAASALRVTIEEVSFEHGDSEVVREEVARSVAQRASGEHEALPALEDVGATPDPDAWPRVTIMNETAHGLLIWVSGPCARTVALPPSTQNEVEVCEGTYQLAGQVARGNFLPLVGGDENLVNGHQYTFTFYVATNPYQRGRTRRR